MLLVVVAVLVVFIVVSLLLMHLVRFLGPAGTLAPPYHLNKATSTAYYAIHGGYCSYGFYCGVFSIVLSASFSWTNWGDGAALSFKLIIIIFLKVVVLTIVFVVVVVVVGSLVVPLMFISTSSLVLLTGSMAPPYHLNLK